MSHKSPTSQNFRQIINMKRLDICAIIMQLDTIKFEMFQGYVEWLNHTFSGNLHKCPYKDLLVINASYYHPERDIDRVTVIPAGLMRCKYKSLAVY